MSTVVNSVTARGVMKIMGHHDTRHCSLQLNTRAAGASFRLPDYRDFNLSLECSLSPASLGSLYSITTPTGQLALQMDTCDFDNEVSNPHHH